MSDDDTNKSARAVAWALSQPKERRQAKSRVGPIREREVTLKPSKPLAATASLCLNAASATSSASFAARSSSEPMPSSGSFRIRWRSASFCSLSVWIVCCRSRICRLRSSLSVFEIVEMWILQRGITSERQYKSSMAAAVVEPSTMSNSSSYIS